MKKLFCLSVFFFCLTCIAQEKLSYERTFYSGNTSSQSIYNKLLRWSDLYVNKVRDNIKYDAGHREIECTASFPIYIDNLGYENTSGWIYYKIGLSCNDNFCHVKIDNIHHISSLSDSEFTSIGDIYKSIPDDIGTTFGKPGNHKKDKLFRIVNAKALNLCSTKIDSVLLTLQANVMRNDPIGVSTLSYSDTIHYNNRDIIFNKIKEWIISNYFNHYSTIQLMDRETETFMVTSRLVFDGNYLVTLPSSGKIYYNLTISCNNNVISVRLDNFYHESENNNRDDKRFFTLGYINNYPKKGNSIQQEVVTKCDLMTSLLITSLRNYINK